MAEMLSAMTVVTVVTTASSRPKIVKAIPAFAVTIKFLVVHLLQLVRATELLQQLPVMLAASFQVSCHQPLPRPQHSMSDLQCPTLCRLPLVQSPQPRAA
jgi:hypothetical protein